MMEPVQIQDDDKFTGLRLPTNIYPINYDLYMKPNLINFTFQGKVSIEYKKTTPDPLKEVVLHANDIKITRGNIDKNVLIKVTYSKSSETATLEFEQPITELGTIVLDFAGILNDKLKGFYRTSFKIDNQTVYAATTKFEPTDARRALPCWDEPALKASFSVTLCYNRWLEIGDKKIEMVGLSNTPVMSQDGDDELIVKFKKTPIMSTYLLAFIIGPFECIEGEDGFRPIRVYTTPGKQEQGQFALFVACKSLLYYEKYFDVPYPLDKMDLIAIPDFGSGAMENWGLVTYRETCLLVDRKNTSTMRKQYVALVVAHELAHQWFGNLVTMEWWTHLWLNEGFATFMEFQCVEHIFPAFKIWNQFVLTSYTTALELDALNSSHPVEVPINHPSEIGEIFDAISYNKGSAIIRMLYRYIGDECFRKGINQYLNKFAYKNAVTEDFWDCLELASNKPVKKVMSSWTSQKGYPWISISYFARQGDIVELKVKQEKFTANGKVTEEDKKILWSVPLFTMVGSTPIRRSLVSIMESKTIRLTVKSVGNNWLKLNPGSFGLYRTAYPDEMDEELRAAISSQSLPPMDRIELLDDYFALSQAGKVSTVCMLKMFKSFLNETNYSVWSCIDSCMSRLNILLLDTEFLKDFQAYGRKIFSGIFNKLTWIPKQNEQDIEALTRAIVINRLVSFGHEDIIKEAKLKFQLHVDGKEPILPDLRAAVYKAVSIYGDDSEFEKLFDEYSKNDMHEERNRIATALGFSNNPNRLQKVIDFAFCNDVRDQDRIFFLIPIGISNPQIAWDMFKERKDTIDQMYQGSHLMRRLIKSCTENFTTKEKALEIEKFFEENKFIGGERSIKQSLETINLNSTWLNRDKKIMKIYLSLLSDVK